ncbi:hypothetical protein OHA25_27335 [Nonomuraea sp. NBC_00507]|uniref:hypothetical protein n=1 Tax=Nonomuraea sp. NBC_00507 TaxID=2976002 RepID=UPI002E18B20F
MILVLYAGPGGIDQGARILSLPQAVHGYDIDADACATARAAGFHRTQASVPYLDPDDFPDATGVVITPPCPPYSRAGLGGGLKDYPTISTALSLLGDYIGGSAAERAYREALTGLIDPRSALVIETLRFAFLMPRVRWVIAEQVPAMAQLWKEIGAELAMTAGWCFIGVISVAAEDFGVASRRTRTFLIATRDYAPDLTGLPMRSLWHTGKFGPPPMDEPVFPCELFPTMSMADALGWSTGERVNTRGNRRTSGGNEFSADKPAWCLTSKTRSWKRISDSAPLTAAQAGLLIGFPTDYPWQGSRSKQFLQAADVVAPPVAAAVLGTVLGLDWQAAVHTYLRNLYPCRTVARGYVQPPLFHQQEVA